MSTAAEQLLTDLETYNYELTGERDEFVRCLKEWRREKKTNQHKMAIHADRMINIILAELSDRWPETFKKQTRKASP